LDHRVDPIAVVGMGARPERSVRVVIACSG
jgi:hypothetical protein